MSQLWTEKFFPKSQAEFVGNSDIVAKSLDWAKKWGEGELLPPLLLWGQTGSGKTCLAYLIAGHFKWGVVELNSSDLRSKETIERVVGAASQNASFFGSRRLILIDEVDALTKNDRGGAAAITSVIKASQNPIILTATDIFASKNISALRFVCKAFEFKKINYLSLAKRLEELLALQGVEYDVDAVKELSRNSSGDMRSALLDLQTLALSGKVTLDGVKAVSARERQQKVFNVMKAIFKGTDFAEVREMRSQSDLSNDLLFMWVDENIPRQYSAPGDVALAFERLSRADVFNGRINNRQHWGFLRYSTELAAEGVALSKERVSHDFVMYQFPGLLSMLSRTSGMRAMRKELGLKIGAKTHSSSRKVVSSDLPFLKDIFTKRENAVSLTALFGLEDKEVAFLLGTTPDTKKVQSIMDDAAVLKEAGAKPKHIFGPAHTDSEPVQTNGSSPEGQKEKPQTEKQGKDEKQMKLF